MNTKPGVHSYLNAIKQTASVGLSAMQADPFEMLHAFVQGTGDLFDIDLISRIATICETKDIRGYVELATIIDALTKNYESEDIELVKGHRVLCSLLKKYPFSKVETPFDTRATAIEKWYAAESQCKETNQRLSLCKADGTLPKFVYHARRLIDDALGELTPNDIMKMLAEGEHGKGTSTECTFRASTVYHKYQSTELYCTSKSQNYAKAAISLNRRWYDYLDGSGVRTKVPLPGSTPGYVESQLLDDVIAISESERISFVEKDAKSMRPIGIGNTLNMYLQLGVKKTLMERLKGVGVDLRDQFKNQNMARVGSLVGSVGDGRRPEQYSTIDLASASDTVSIGICELLLPSEWFGLLSDLRHESGVLDDDTIVYSKMSAMGNGFTFPLESLLFWAIAKATAECMDYTLTSEDLAVYGDDLILPLMFAPGLVENLTWCGFTVNSEKSFMSGPFKESCGADYYQGINVRPYYLKRRFKTTKALYHVANAILPRTLDSSCRVSKGYRALYCKLQETIESVGPINYRPLSDIVAVDKLGNNCYHDSDQGLSVPYSHYCDVGLGYLSTRDKIQCYNKRLFPRVAKRFRNKDLSAIISGTLLYALRRTERPEKEKDVKEPLRLLTRLQSKEVASGGGDRYESFEERFCEDADGTTRITCKGNIETTFTLQPVLNWNGPAGKGLLRAHPVLW